MRNKIRVLAIIPAMLFAVAVTVTACDELENGDMMPEQQQPLN